MTRFESASGNAFGRLPARRPLVMRSYVRRGVESQPGDDGEGVTVTRVNGDPLATAAFAVLAKFR